MLEVVYPPGSSDPVHQHHSYTFVYILEGTVVMHIVGHNASKTKPAKFLAFFVTDKGAPILTPVK